MQVEVTAIKSRVSGDGHPFCEVFYEVLTEGPHFTTIAAGFGIRSWTRAAERAAFIKRQQKVPWC